MRTILHTFALGTALCLSLGAGAALAQDAASTPQDAPPPAQGMHHGHGPMTPEEQLAHMTRALNLTPDQQTQIKPLLEAHRQQMMQLREDQSLSRDDKHTKIETINTDTHSKVEAVLNDAQKTKFEKMQEHREGQWQEHGGGDPNGAQPPQ